MATFDIDEILEAASALSFDAARPTRDRVDVNLSSSEVLVFENVGGTQEPDTLIRFEGGWHSHGDIMAEILDVELKDVPFALLDALRSGHALLVTERSSSGAPSTGIELKAHISTSDIDLLEEGESICYHRLASRPGSADRAGRT